MNIHSYYIAGQFPGNGGSLTHRLPRKLFFTYLRLWNGYLLRSTPLPLPSSAALSSMLPLRCHYYYSLLNTLLLCGRSSYSSHWTGRALFHEKINCANFAEPGSYLDTITQKNIWEILTKAIL